MKSLKFTIFLKLCTLIVILGYTSSIYAQLGCCDINAASPSAPTTIGVTTYTTVDVDMYLDPTYGCEAVLSKATIPNITASYPNCTRWTFWRAVPTGAYPATPTDLISSGAAVTFNTALQQYNQVVFNVDSLLFHNANAVAPYSNTTRDIYYYVTVSNPNNPTCMSHPIMLRINLFDNIAPTVTCPSPITQTHTIACNDNIEYLCPGDLVLSDLSDNCSDEEDLTYMIEITDACGTTFGPFTEDDFLATYDCSLTDGFPFQVGLNTISHIVTDQFGNESSCITEVIIKRPDPVIGCNPGPITVALPGLNYDGRDTAYLFGNAFLSFFDDPCISGAEILTPAGTPGGYHVRLSFNPTDISSFKDTLTLTCPDVNQLRTVYIRIFDEDAIDCAGNPISRYSDYCPSTVRLIDTHGPRIICPPAVSIECDDVSVGTSPTGLYNYFRSLPTSISASQDSLKVWPRVSDNCNNLTVTYYDSIPNVLGSNCYSIYRIWTVTDNNLQFSTFASSKCIQQISIYDITRPTITSITGPATYYCTNPLPQVNLVLSDNCASATDLSNQLEVLSTISTQATALNNYSHYNYSVTRNYRVHDNCGNFRDTFHITSY
ncbi:MAG: hypothetical protein KA974_11235, partial [Saprospiraceae bacterium]|nr:hypothetical protein [Saprospiraceae bacterium]